MPHSEWQPSRYADDRNDGARSRQAGTPRGRYNARDTDQALKNIFGDRRGTGSQQEPPEHIRRAMNPAPGKPRSPEFERRGRRGNSRPSSAGRVPARRLPSIDLNELPLDGRRDTLEGLSPELQRLARSSSPSLAGRRRGRALIKLREENEGYRAELQDYKMKEIKWGTKRKKLELRSNHLEKQMHALGQARDAEQAELRSKLETVRERCQRQKTKIDGLSTSRVSQMMGSLTGKIESQRDEVKRLKEDLRFKDEMLESKEKMMTALTIKHTQLEQHALDQQNYAGQLQKVLDDTRQNHQRLRVNFEHSQAECATLRKQSSESQNHGLLSLGQTVEEMKKLREILVQKETQVRKLQVEAQKAVRGQEEYKTSYLLTRQRLDQAHEVINTAQGTHQTQLDQTETEAARRIAAQERTIEVLREEIRQLIDEGTQKDRRIAQGMALQRELSTVDARVREKNEQIALLRERMSSCGVRIPDGARVQVKEVSAQVDSLPDVRRYGACLVLGADVACMDNVFKNVQNVRKIVEAVLAGREPEDELLVGDDFFPPPESKTELVKKHRAEHFKSRLLAVQGLARDLRQTLADHCAENCAQECAMQ